MAKRRSSRRVRRGGKFGDWLKKAGAWLRKSKLLSTVGSIYAKTGLPGSQFVGKAAGIAGQLGYGRRRRRRRCGGALRRAGGMRHRIR